MMKSVPYFSKTIFIAVFAAQWTAGLVTAFSEPSDPFPTYPSQRSNVAFWKKVYTVYSTSQSIVHDRRNLEIIYEVIPLKDPRSAGAARANAERIKQTKRRYEQLLRALATGETPVSAEEKRIHALFVETGSRSLLKDAHLNVRFQLGQKDRFRSGLIRSGAFLDEIKQIFRQYGLPEDLAYLPHVESSFEYEAYSKFGAAGIWQFTRGTGKRYMTIDYTIDERRDPIKATHAAAKFLKENYDALGSWPMAITAYNHGTGGMLKAKKSKGHYEAVFNDYGGRSFGFASRNFYSEFLAAREIAKDYRRYFHDLELAAPVSRHTIELPGYVSLRELARRFQVDLETLRQFNPSLREPVFRGQKYVPKGFLLHLPARPGSGPAYMAEIPAEMIKSGQKPSRFHRVRKGETASEIAKLHGVGLSDLVRANGLNSRATIYAGQNLRIPVQEEKVLLASASEPRPKAAVTATVAKGKEPSTKKAAASPPAAKAPLPEEMPSSSPVPEPVPAPAAAPASPPVREPATAGKVEPSKQALPDNARESLEEALQVNPAVVVGNFSVEKVFTRKGRTFGVIQVEPEETLGHYADWLQIPTQKIRDLNRFSFRKSIHVGQKIEIPFGKVGREEFEESRYEYHKEIEEDFFAAYTVENFTTYGVEPGDNIWTLCQVKFDLPFWLLKKYNAEIDFNRLVPSQPLVIPIVSKIGEISGPTVPEVNGDANGNEGNGPDTEEEE